MNFAKPSIISHWRHQFRFSFTLIFSPKSMEHHRDGWFSNWESELVGGSKLSASWHPHHAEIAKKFQRGVENVFEITRNFHLADSQHFFSLSWCHTAVISYLSFPIDFYALGDQFFLIVPPVFLLSDKEFVISEQYLHSLRRIVIFEVLWFMIRYSKDFSILSTLSTFFAV